LKERTGFAGHHDVYYGMRPEISVKENVWRAEIRTGKQVLRAGII
jgi:hypothetical protein